MSSSRIYHNVSKIPVVSTVVLIAANYELYRIHKGTHPYWTPKLEAAGIVTRGNKTAAEPSDNNAVRAKGSSGDATGEFAIRWTNLNGVPIPTLEALMPPFGKN